MTDKDKREPSPGGIFGGLFGGFFDLDGDGITSLDEDLMAIAFLDDLDRETYKNDDRDDWDDEL